MRGAVRPLLASLFLILTVAISTQAADTGTISGAVFDSTGTPVADATVKISGDPLPIGRSVESDANGSYTLEYLEPGTYILEVAKEGIGTARRAVVAEVGRDTQVDLVIGLSVREELTSRRRPSPWSMCDPPKSASTSRPTRFTSLPLERTYRGLFQLIPGVADNRSPVGPAAGGSRQDNTYLIDGANITNPAFGTLSTEVNELDIAEVNLKRAGISAEFGRTAGTVTNAVSRSGSNTVFRHRPDRLAVERSGQRLQASRRPARRRRQAGRRSATRC